MRIIIDAMGGDNAPLEVVLGACEALEAYPDVELTLVGREGEIRSVIEQHNLTPDESRLTIVHTEQVITMEDAPLSVIRQKNDSSMSVALRMLAEGKGDAMISAGNTGALHAGSSLLVRRIKGIQRSAIASVLPCASPTLLIDSGANIEVEPAHMLQFASMGSIYMNKVLGVENPRVGLLNNGTEPTKGTKKLVEAYGLLSAQEDINFIGNVEGKQVPYGVCDVLVTDGFTGNVMLKAIEGTASYLIHEIKGLFYQNALTKLSALPVKKGMKQLKNSFDASEYGGAPLLGLSKPVIKAHGSSDARAIKNAVRQAISFVENEVIVEIVLRTVKPAAPAPQPEPRETEEAQEQRQKEGMENVK